MCGSWTHDGCSCTRDRSRRGHWPQRTELHYGEVGESGTNTLSLPSCRLPPPAQPPGSLEDLPVAHGAERAGEAEGSLLLGDQGEVFKAGAAQASSSGKRGALPGTPFFLFFLKLIN